MQFKSKTYKIFTTKNELMSLLRNKLRIVPEFSFYIPFFNSKCEWITGNVGASSFELADYRLSTKLIFFKGIIEEHRDHLIVHFFVNISNKVVVVQSLFILSFVLGIFLPGTTEAELSIFAILIFVEIGNYLLYLNISLSFYGFFYSLFKANNIEIFLEV